MQNVRLDEVDGAALDVLPISTDYPAGHVLTWHEHRRAQLLYAATGVMVVQTQHQTWTVPTQQAVLIPPRTPHQVQMLEVSTLSLYIEEAAVPWWPRQCTVVEVTSLLRELLRTAAAFPLDYDVEGRAGSIVRLALTEIAELAPLPFSVHLPAVASLRQLCVDYLAAPDVAVTNAQWAARAHMSERTLDRAFRGATGLAPAAWRVRARLLAAVPMLQSATVSEVATALGYASAAAFSAAFGRALGTSPSRFR